MNRYLDTSLLVAAFTREAKTAAVQKWLRARKPEELFISGFVTTEFSSALSIKLRTKQITETHRADALAQFARMVADSLSMLPVSQADFLRAAQFADRHELGLRAGDALHLAVAGRAGATLYTIDKLQADAGAKLGVRTRLL